MDQRGTQSGQFAGSQQTSAGTTAGQAVDQAKGTLSDAVDTGKEQLGQVADQAKQQANEQVQGQLGFVADQIESVSKAVTHASTSLREQDQDWMAGYADQAADMVDGFAGYLRSADMDRLMMDAEGFARRQPALFIGGAFLLGIMAARFLKSSAPRPAWNGGSGSGYGSYRYGSQYGYGRGGYGYGGQSYAGGAGSGYGNGGSGTVRDYAPQASTMTTAGASGMPPQYTTPGGTGSASTETASTPGGSGYRGQTPGTAGAASAPSTPSTAAPRPAPLGNRGVSQGATPASQRPGSSPSEL